MLQIILVLVVILLFILSTLSVDDIDENKSIYCYIVEENGKKYRVEECRGLIHNFKEIDKKC